MSPSPRRYLLLTRSICASDPETTLREALAGGVDLVQIREKPFHPGDEAWVERVVEICGEHDIRCIVNDSTELARKADGVHLGQEDLEIFSPGQLREREQILGISTHNLEEVERAMLEEPDYLGIGPCFETRTKGYDTGLTDEELRTLVRATSNIPTFAIGGITSKNLGRLLEHGVRRIAVSSTILAAQDPRSASRALADALRDAPDAP